MSAAFILLSQPFSPNITLSSTAYAENHLDHIKSCAQVDPSWYTTANCNGECSGGVEKCRPVQADVLPPNLKCYECLQNRLCKESEGKYLFEGCGGDCKEDEECGKESPDRLCFECFKKENPCIAEDGEFYSADCNGVCRVYDEQCVPAEKEGCYWCVGEIDFKSCKDEGLKDVCERDEVCKEVQVDDIICCKCLKKAVKKKRPTTGDGGGSGRAVTVGGGTGVGTTNVPKKHKCEVADFFIGLCPGGCDPYDVTEP